MLAEDYKELLKLPHPSTSIVASTMQDLVEAEGENNPYIMLI